MHCVNSSSDPSSVGARVCWYAFTNFFVFAFSNYEITTSDRDDDVAFLNGTRSQNSSNFAKYLKICITVEGTAKELSWSHFRISIISSNDSKVRIISYSVLVSTIKHCPCASTQCFGTLQLRIFTTVGNVRENHPVQHDKQHYGKTLLSSFI